MLAFPLTIVTICELLCFHCSIYIQFFKLIRCLILQLNGTKRTATTAGPPPAAVAERGKGGAETGIDAAETAVVTVRTADTDAG